jgi:AraC-like DNA-binding protein
MNSRSEGTAARPVRNLSARSLVLPDGERFLKYREQSPSGELGRFVECFWFLEGEPIAPRPLERLLPIGSIEVVVHHRSPFREWPDASHPRMLPPGVVAGQLTRPLFIQPAGPISTMGVRFRPGGAYPFLGTRLDALTDRIVSFEEVWGAEGRRFEERLVLANDDEQRVSVAEAFFRSRMGSRPHRDEPVEAAAAEIGRSGGRVRVSALACRLGLSARQMERRFASALGVGPKVLCRVARFQALLRAIARARRPDWAGLAADCGYFDQAHLINEVRRLSGMTPRGLAAKRAGGAGREPGFTLDGAAGLRVCPAAAAPPAFSY